MKNWTSDGSVVRELILVCKRVYCSTENIPLLIYFSLTHSYRSFGNGLYGGNYTLGGCAHITSYIEMRSILSRSFAAADDTMEHHVNHPHLSRCCHYPCRGIIIAINDCYS